MKMMDPVRRVFDKAVFVCGDAIIHSLSDPCPEHFT